MATTTGDFVSTLNNLIEINKDGEEGYRQAAEKAKAPQFKSLFSEYSAQRASNASELQSAVAKLGKTPEDSGTVSGSVHRGWLSLKDAITSSDDQALIDECERGEDHAVEAYRHALAKDLPADLKAIVEKQNVNIQASHAKVRDLKHSKAGKTAAGTV